MRSLSECPSCGSQKIRPYSFTPTEERGNAIHGSQSHCAKCDLVFSNPVAEAEELERYYAASYYEGFNDQHDPEGPELEAFVHSKIEFSQNGLRKMLLPYGKTSGTFFEIGAGYGSVMAAAENLGFKSFGVEPSQKAVEFAKTKLRLTNVRHGMFEPGLWPENFFDVVYSHHVIEHVTDLDHFVSGVFKLLKPGGLVITGTESHRNSWVIYRKVRSLLQGRRLPEFQTADHHTFYFSGSSLSFLLKKHGFHIKRVWVYNHSLKDKLKHASFRSPFSMAFFYLMHFADFAFRGGNRLVIWAMKPQNKPAGIRHA